MSKPSKSFSLLIAQFATAMGLSPSAYVRLKVCQALAIERHLGNEKWQDLLMTLENERLSKKMDHAHLLALADAKEDLEIDKAFEMPSRTTPKKEAKIWQERYNRLMSKLTI